MFTNMDSSVHGSTTTYKSGTHLVLPANRWETTQQLAGPGTSRHTSTVGQHDPS